ncbi:hypothetical protein RYX36_013158 [Vicia faba]
MGDSDKMPIARSHQKPKEQNNQCDIQEKECDVLKELPDRASAKISQEGSSLEEDNKVVFSSLVDFIDDQEMKVDDNGVDNDEDEMVVEDGSANGVQSELRTRF